MFQWVMDLQGFPQGQSGNPCVCEWSADYVGQAPVSKMLTYSWKMFEAIQTDIWTL